MKYAPLLLVLVLAACASQPKPAEPDDSKYQAEANARMERILGFHYEVACDAACLRTPYWTLPGNMPVVTAPDMAAAPFHDTTAGK